MTSESRSGDLGIRLEFQERYAGHFLPLISKGMSNISIRVLIHRTLGRLVWERPTSIS